MGYSVPTVHKVGNSQKTNYLNDLSDRCLIFVYFLLLRRVHQNFYLFGNKFSANISAVCSKSWVFIFIYVYLGRGQLSIPSTINISDELRY